MALVELATAKAHLNLADDDDAHNEDVALKLEQAEAIIVGRCNSTAFWRAVTATWTDANVPAEVRAAILVMLTHMYENRGDDMRLDDALWVAVDRLIGSYKDPVLA